MTPPPSDPSAYVAQQPILVIDDDLDTRAATVELLEDSGYSAISARNGLEAMQILRGGMKPSAMLIDLYMPLMDGEALCQELDRDPALGGIPRIVISSRRDGQTRVARCGARAFVAKPIKPDALFDALGEIELYARPQLKRPRRH